MTLVRNPCAGPHSLYPPVRTQNFVSIYCDFLDHQHHDLFSRCQESSSRDSSNKIVISPTFSSIDQLQDEACSSPYSPYIQSAKKTEKVGQGYFCEDPDCRFNYGEDISEFGSVYCDCEKLFCHEHYNIHKCTSITAQADHEVYDIIKQNKISGITSPAEENIALDKPFAKPIERISPSTPESVIVIATKPNDFQRSEALTTESQKTDQYLSEKTEVMQLKKVLNALEFRISVTQFMIQQELGMANARFSLRKPSTTPIREPIYPSSRSSRDLPYLTESTKVQIQIQDTVGRLQTVVNEFQRINQENVHRPSREASATATRRNSPLI